MARFQVLRGWPDARGSVSELVLTINGTETVRPGNVVTLTAQGQATLLTATSPDTTNNSQADMGTIPLFLVVQGNDTTAGYGDFSGSYTDKCVVLIGGGYQVQVPYSNRRGAWRSASTATDVPLIGDPVAVDTGLLCERNAAVSNIAAASEIFGWVSDNSATITDINGVAGLVTIIVK